MDRIKYLIIFCILIVTLSAIVRYSENLNNIGQTKEDESVLIVGADESNVNVSNDILIDDHEKLIIVSPEPKKVINKPYITAESYIVANLSTGEVYLSHSPDRVFPIASISKLFTALVVHHFFDQEKEIIITQSMLDAYGDAGHLILNEKFVIGEMLNFLLIESSNDAAEAFAQSYDNTSTSTEKFIVEMNNFAKKIGMKSTSFSDASGLSQKNVSNASDLFVLSKYLYESEQDILDISKIKEIDIATTTDHGSHHLSNINPFSSYNDFQGGKTGRTDQAKEAMVTILNHKVNGIVYPLAVIILRSDFGQREINTEKLIGLFDDKIISVKNSN